MASGVTPSHPAPASLEGDLEASLDGSLVAGVLSGTSADGIDVALCRIRLSGPGARPRVVGAEVVRCETVRMEPDLAARVRGVLEGGPLRLADLATLDRDLGRAFGSAAREVARRAGAGPLALVASHGQTVFHHDGDPALGKVTLQLGDGDHVAEAAGCAVASDFRTRDCAAGGEGAPLVVLVDEVLFGASPRPLAVLNLGGIANWTLLREGEPPVGADAGPAGAVLDGLARALLQAPMDEDGRAAAAGRVVDRVLERLLEHPFLARPWPKTTGLDTFGAGFLGELINGARGVSPEDLLATATRFVARAAADDLFLRGPELATCASLHVAVAGGGARNGTLIGMLEEELEARARAGGARLASFGASDSLGVPADFREGMAFAVLGARLAVGEASTHPAVTGARAGRVLGKWSPGAQGTVSPWDGPSDLDGIRGREES